jgi:hypothetical protein
MQPIIKAYLAAETVDLLTDAPSLGAVLRAEAEALQRLIRHATDALEHVKASAIAEGVATYSLTQRETPPNKATYVQLYGREAFDAHKRVTTVRTFAWIM